MKKFVVLSMVLLTLSSCLKNRLRNDPSALVNYRIESAFDEMTNISDQAVTGNMVFYKSGKVVFAKPGYDVSTLKTPCNVIITLDTVAFPRTLTVDYGTENCDCNDGKKRRGKIITTFTGPYLATGSVITHTPEDYFVNDVKIEGTKTVENMGQNAQGQPYFNVAINGIGTMTDGMVANYTSTRVRTWTEGFNTLLNRFDDVYEITGTADATFSTGGGYTGATVTPIKIKIGCGFPVRGIIDLTPEGKPTRTIDYGDGACDRQIKVTVNGWSFNIGL